VLACAVHGDALEHLLGGVSILAVLWLLVAGCWWLVAGRRGASRWVVDVS
jgi:hypothetical protein